MILKIINSIHVFSKAGRPFLSIFKKGSSVASTQILYAAGKYIKSLHSIIDVGANQGQFALTACFFYPEAKIFSFEPVPDTYKVLVNNVKNNPNIKLFQVALGNSNGEIDFFSNDYSHASSALPISEKQKELLPKTNHQNKIKVPVKKLDDMIGGLELVHPILLKLDVQGFEKEVLKGGVQFLKEKVDYLLFEASFVSMYDGEPLFEEMHAYVKEAGFELIGPVGFLETDDLQILQMDMLYKKKGI